MNDPNRLGRIANWIGAVMGLIAAVLIPLGYYTIAYKYTVGSLQAEAEINGRIFSGLINKNPQFWQYEQMRLEALLSRRPDTGEKESRRIFNLQNEIVAQSDDALAAPRVSRRHPLKDSGLTVGMLEISRSMRPIIIKAAGIACLGLIIGMSLFIAMKNLPFQAVIKAERALRKSEEQYRSLFENMLNGFAFCRMIYEEGRPKDFVYLKVNEAFEKLTGLENVVGKRASEIIPGIQEKDPAVIDAYDRVALTGKPEVFETYVESLAMWFSISAYSPFKEHFVAIFDVITDRKQAEALLRESEERFRMLLKNANDAVYVNEVTTAGTGKFIEINDQACEMLGYHREELLGMTLSDIEVARQREMTPAILRDLDEAGRSLFETEHVARDGRRIPVEVSARILSLREKPIMLSLVRDISERKRLEAEHRTLQDRLQHAQRMESVGRLAGGVAHDYNNMLSVILGYTELSMEVVNPDEPLYENLKEIYGAAHRSKAVTRQLLAFARRQTIAPIVLDLNETVESMLKMLRRLIGENIDLAWRPGNHLWPVKMDPAQIDQILANLCVNARDAINGVGNVTIETRRATFDDAYCAQHAGFTPGQFDLLAVSDDGHGMDPDTREKIFEPFFTTKEVGQGTGLGLATVYGIVKQNDGFINVYSEPGKGTTFRIFLPAHAGEAGEASPPSGIPPTPAGRGETILIVEDEAPLLKLGKRVLEKLGYQVLTADTPGKALQLTETVDRPIHLLLVDVVMPEMNGRDLAQKMAARFPDIKILFMSGYTADVIAHQGILDEGVNFIQKPLSTKDLALKVRTILDASEA